MQENVGLHDKDNRYKQKLVGKYEKEKLNKGRNNKMLTNQCLF